MLVLLRGVGRRKAEARKGIQFKQRRRRRREEMEMQQQLGKEEDDDGLLLVVMIYLKSEGGRGSASAYLSVCVCDGDDGECLIGCVVSCMWLVVCNEKEVKWDGWRPASQRYTNKRTQPKGKGNPRKKQGPYTYRFWGTISSIHIHTYKHVLVK